MKYFDTHAHYYDERFAAECQEEVDSLLSRLFEGEIEAIVDVGTNPVTCRLAVEQAKRYPRMYTALGIHPTDCQPIADIDAAIDEVKEMILDPASKCLLVGEIGLDYHYEDTEREKQIAVFERQLDLAEELCLPVCIHDRDAHGDTLEILNRHPKTRAILHSFSGSAEMAKELCAMGHMISFSGTVSFTNARKTKEAAAVIPRDRLLIETDCPYLAPHPLRGTLNHSGNLVYTNAALAAAIGITSEKCAELTSANARRFLGIG